MLLEQPKVYNWKGAFVVETFIVSPVCTCEKIKRVWEFQVSWPTKKIQFEERFSGRLLFCFVVEHFCGFHFPSKMRILWISSYLTMKIQLKKVCFLQTSSLFLQSASGPSKVKHFYGFFVPAKLNKEKRMFLWLQTPSLFLQSTLDPQHCSRNSSQ